MDVEGESLFFDFQRQEGNENQSIFRPYGWQPLVERRWRRARRLVLFRLPQDAR